MKNVIKYIVLTIALSHSFAAMAQLEPQYTHYMYNIMSVNPAYAGTSEATSVTLLSRIQWMGFDNNPKTTFISAHTPINSGQTGAGISVISDSQGPINRLYSDLNYAHRVRLSSSLTLSLGLKASLLSGNANLTEFVVNDPAFTNEKFFNMNCGVGAFLYSDEYYIGLSVPRIIESDFSSNTYSLGSVKRHYFLTAGYVYQLNPDVKLKPSIFTKMVPQEAFTCDVAFEGMYLDTYRLGLNYRYKDALSFMAGIVVNDWFTVSYSYDTPTSYVSQYSKGSHEIYLNFLFSSFEKKKVYSPRFY